MDPSYHGNFAHHCFYKARAINEGLKYMANKIAA
jgi:hypothetical protein